MCSKSHASNTQTGASSLIQANTNLEAAEAEIYGFLNDVIELYSTHDLSLEHHGHAGGRAPDHPLRLARPHSASRSPHARALVSPHERRSPSRRAHRKTRANWELRPMGKRTLRTEPHDRAGGDCSRGGDQRAHQLARGAHRAH